MAAGGRGGEGRSEDHSGQTHADQPGGLDKGLVPKPPEAVTKARWHRGSHLRGY